MESQLSISKAYVKDYGSVPKHYVQYLRLQNQPIYFQSTLFYSSGPRKGLGDDNYHLCISLTPEVRQALTSIENFVADHLEIPSPFAEKWKQHSKASGDQDPLKRLYNAQNIFVKIGRQVSLFNMDHEVDNKYQPFENPIPPLGEGWYIVYFSVSSVYIGSHNANPKAASLRLRIEQIVYRPKSRDECHIQPIRQLDCQQQQIPLAEDISVDDFIDEIFSNDKSKNNDSAITKVPRKRNKKGELKKPSKADTIQNVIDSVVHTK